ncbi:MAG: hypothetical protein K2W33_04115, partial [Burkholderiales bacterium]|nr:hypothetical protein [Burkholderiales bacterium]
MTNGLRRLWPSTLREQMVAVLVPLLLLACGTLGYVLTHIGEEAILEEKGSSLQGVNRTQLLRLKALGGFAALEAGTQPGASPPAQAGQTVAADKAARVARLNAALRDLTEDIAAAFPGVGLGYYHRELDAIVTYGPASLFGDKVGVAVAADHPGRRVMQSGQSEVQSGVL